MKYREFRQLPVWLALAACSVWSAEMLPESQAKAGPFYNFSKFVEWPAGAFSDADSRIVRCVVGADPFGAARRRGLKFSARLLQLASRVIGRK
jgi:hypothetical protein